jgi:serine/threonine protein phosphatase PrpC
MESTMHPKGMGTTIVMLLALQKTVISPCGDSRVYLIRDHHLQQLTEDIVWPES